MSSIFALFFVFLLLRFIPERERTEANWSGLWELVIALVVGVAFALLGTFWFSRFHIVGDSLSSDLYDFCGSVAAMRDGAIDEFSRDRSYAAGYMPAFFAERYGVANGLAISAIVSLAMIGSGLYVWARALSSRLGGLLAAIFGLSLAPVVLLGRTLTFYPEYVAVFTLASGLVCLAINLRRPLYYLLAGLGIAACLLIDLRGVVWAVPLSFAAILIAMALRSKKSLLLIVLFVLPIWGSWTLGSQVYTARSTSLEAQANPIRLFYEHGTPTPDAPSERRNSHADAFVWGRTPITSVPATLYNLVMDTRKVSPLMSDESVVVNGRTSHLTPLFTLGLVTFFVALISTVRRPRRAIGLLLSSAPFLIVLYHASHLEFRHRFAASGLPVLAIFFGVAAAWVIRAPLPQKLSAITTRPNKSQQSPWRLPSIRATLLLGLTTAAVAGVMPSTLGPSAPWRTPFVADNELIRMIHAARTGTSLSAWGSQTCIDGLADDMKNDRLVGTTILTR